MNPNEQDLPGYAPASPAPVHHPDHPWAGWRRLAAAAMLGATLLTGAGVAVVNAASPAPTGSTSAPAATTPGTTATPGATGTHSCP